jgi:N utilization substance protein A
MTVPARSLAGSPDLLEAIAELAGQAGVDEAELAAIVETAILDTYHRLVDEVTPVAVHADLRGGTVDLAEVTADGEVPLPPLAGDVARQAAQAVRVAVGERLRAAGAERVLTDAALRRGELIDTIVARRAGRLWILRAADQDVVLPPEEQAGDEELEPGRHLKVMILEGRRKGGDAILVVSRSHPQLLRLLLEQEVPELSRGQVVIREIAREAGRRSKVAVDSTDPDIDPQGACIGPKGIRHRAITSELGTEQVQIVRWSNDPAQLVANSLIPADVRSVSLDEETRTAHVIVDPDQLSLAIGRGGENARLAARLTGWRIDIAAPEAAPPADDA